MIISVEKKEFMEAVRTVTRFAERRSATLAALSGIAIIADSDVIKLRATNLEVGIDLAVNGNIKQAGVVVLPAAVLREFATSLAGEGTVTIEYAGETAVITQPGGKSVLKTLPAEDFPTIPIPTKTDKNPSLKGQTLIDLFGAVIACASPSTVRPELNSVLFSQEGGILTAVASDSFRLAEKKVPNKDSGTPFSILIPAKNIGDILPVLPPEGMVNLLIDEHQCAFSWEQGVATTRLVSAQYPDYAQIIPKTFAAEATLLRKDLEVALHRVAVFSDSFQKVQCAFNSKEKKMVLSSHNSDVGESSETVAATITGESFTLSFNHRYLSAPLSLIQTDTLTLGAAGVGRPLIIRGAGDTSFLYLVMPMNQ